MNDDLTRRLDRLAAAERTRAVRDAARRYQIETDQPAPVADGPRRGIARVTSNLGDGEYTITERWWDADADAWTDAAEPLGYVAADARDFQGRDSAQAGDTVAFWEQRARDGTLVLLIDVARPPSESGFAGDDLARLFRVSVSDNGSVTLDEADWRDRAIWISASVDAGGDNSFSSHGVHDGADYMGVVQEFDGGDIDYILFTTAVGGGFGDFKVHVDGADEGKLKLTAYNFAASPDSYTVVLWARASRTITGNTHTIN